MDLTMVIADDEPIVLKSLEMKVKKEFPEVSILGTAKNGIELKELLESFDPDMAIVDIRMPGLSGIEVIELLRDRGLKTRYIINTAFSDFEYAKKALDLKTDGYLLKPGKREEKREVIGRLIASIREERKESTRKKYLDSAIDVVNPVLGSEILMSIFSDKPDEEHFRQYLSINAIEFSEGCILTYLPGRDVKRKDINRELGAAMQGLCDFLTTVTSEGIVVMLFIPQEFDDPESAVGWRDEMAELIHGCIEKLTDEDCLYGAGGIYGSFSDMRLSYQESIAALGPEKTGVMDPMEDERYLESRNKDYVQQAEGFINENYMRDISLSDCAGHVGISSYYLSHIFKDRTGSNFVEYLTDVRIKHAMELCADPGLTVRDIAERSGYLNTTYFCKVFKKLVGSTIGEYRRQLKTENT